jgi:hypothetical protein
MMRTSGVACRGWRRWRYLEGSEVIAIINIIGLE